MEFYDLRKGKVVEDKKRKWFKHEFGVIACCGSDFLEELEDKINAVYQRTLFKKAEGAGKGRLWIESMDTPITLIEVKGISVLVWRRSDYYSTYSGQQILVFQFDLKEAIVKTMNEILRRKEEVDDKERECCLWILNKKGVKVKWQKEQ